MIEFKAKNEEYRIANAFKNILKEFILNSSHISPGQKDSIQKEIRDFKPDYQIQEEIVDYAFGHYSSKWKQENFELVELWKKICVQNASSNNEPHLTADAAVESFKKSFKIN